MCILFKWPRYFGVLADCEALRLQKGDIKLNADQGGNLELWPTTAVSVSFMQEITCVFFDTFFVTPFFAPSETTFSQLF